MTRSRQASLLMLAMVWVWGSTFVVVKSALHDISPLLFNLLRMTLAFLCLSIAYRKEWPRLTPRAWTGGAVVGLFLAMGYQFQTAGLRLTTPSKSAFLTGLAVVIVPLLAALPALRSLGTEAPRWNVWLGAGLSFAGIILLTAPPKATGSSAAARGGFGPVNAGDILSLGCAVGFALQLIAQDRFSRQSGDQQAVPFAQLALLQIGFAMVYMAFTLPFFEKPHLHPSSRLVVALIITAVLATAVAFSAMSWSQQWLAPSLLALILALEPVFAWLTSLVVLREGLSGRASLGAVLILVGMGAAEWIRSSI